MQNAELLFNFGDSPFQYPPKVQWKINELFLKKVLVILQAFLAPISYRAVISSWLNSKFENESNKTSIGGIVGWMIGYLPWKYRFLHSVEPELSESFEVDGWVVKVISQSRDILFKKRHL